MQKDGKVENSSAPCFQSAQTSCGPGTALTPVTTLADSFLQVCSSDNAFGIEMFPGIDSTYLDSDSSEKESHCFWTMVCPVEKQMNKRGWSMPELRKSQIIHGGGQGRPPGEGDISCKD